MKEAIVYDVGPKALIPIDVGQIREIKSSCKVWGNSGFILNGKVQDWLGKF